MLYGICYLLATEDPSTGLRCTCGGCDPALLIMVSLEMNRGPVNGSPCLEVDPDGFLVLTLVIHMPPKFRTNHGLIYVLKSKSAALY